MKLGYMICTMAMFICVKGFTQINPRMTNANYMYTALYDGFDGTTLNQNIWGVEANWRRDDTQNIWVDSPNTVSQDS